MAKEPNDDKTGEDQIIEPDPVKVSIDTPSPTITLSFNADNIQEKLNDGEYALALILTSTRLENVLTTGLKQRLDVDKNQFESLWGSETLGTYGQMCSVLGVFGSEYEQEVIDNVVSLRNNLVHDDGFFETTETDSAVQQDIEESVGEAIAFIEKVEI